jgi:hypothetical protein
MATTQGKFIWYDLVATDIAEDVITLEILC